MKKTRIKYNPYENTIGIVSAPSLDADWQLLPDKSPLLGYVKTPSLFSNCVLDIVERIDKGQNSSSDGLEIQFCGTDADFRTLEETVREVDARRIGAGPLSARRTGVYASAEKAIAVIRACYGRIASEFEDFLPGGPKYADRKDLGEAIVKFEETVSDEIPVCFVGNYSVGKSALINAIIGEEVMPSTVNPTTARNVKIVHDPARCRLTLDRKVDGVSRSVAFDAIRGSLSFIGEDRRDAEWAARFLSLVGEKTPLQGKSAKAVLHDALEFLNGLEDEGAGILREIGMNVLVEVPFANSAITDMGRGIAFYDTPGSNNSSIDQKEHKDALEAFLTGQTNALPIVTTTKQSIMSNDNLELKKKLDEYKANFSSLNSLIVIAQCDKLSSTELASKIPSSIQTWHGMTPVLYTTAVGALGERKGGKSDWIDAGLAEGYRLWRRAYEEDPETKSLPQYNLVPRSGADELDSVQVSTPELYATGLPSLEGEIMRYALEYADYKKCERGRRDLLISLALVRDDIEKRKQRLEDEKALSERRRASTKCELLESLSEIRPALLKPFSDTLREEFADAVDYYLMGVKSAIVAAYDDAISKQEADIDNYVNTRIRDHCQKELIDKLYLGEKGIQSRIVAELEMHAEQFANELHQFIEGNDVHFTATGKAALDEIVAGSDSVPILENVSSNLPTLQGLFQVLSVAQYNVFKLLGDERRAKEVWVESRCDRLGEILKDGIFLPGISRLGEFSKTAIVNPVHSYDEQLHDWADAYRNLIEGCIDRENSVLSGMEAAIAEQEAEIVDLEGRIVRLDDAERELVEVLNLASLADKDGGAADVG